MRHVCAKTGRVGRTTIESGAWQVGSFGLYNHPRGSAGSLRQRNLGGFRRARRLVRTASLVRDMSAGVARAPDNEMLVIEPGRRFAAVQIKELWQHRELLYFLVWRDIKVRYKQTALGAAWAILQPLATAAVFTIFFGRLAGIPSGGVPYPLFAYSGLLVWTFFAQGLAQSSASVVGSANLITKVYFPASSSRSRRRCPASWTWLSRLRS